MSLRLEAKRDRGVIMFKRPVNETQEAGPVFSSNEPAESPATKKISEKAIVGPSILVRGVIEGDQDLVVDGEVEGNISLKDHTVTIGRSGRVRANIYARVIIVEGDVTGDLLASEKVVVMRSGNVRGNITAPRASLEDGAKLKGSIDMDPQAGETGNSRSKPAPAEETASYSSVEKPNGQLHV
jgi:cytoskeletal protein CcmA (bactofilin family)